jgi:cellulose biosynthesis protein BcsQ
MSVAPAHPALLLFAQTMPTPSWTDKEVLIAIGSVVGTMLTVGVPVVMYLIRRAGANSRKRAKKADADNQKLRTEILELHKELNTLTQGTITGKQKLDELTAHMQRAQQEVEKLLASKARSEDEAASQRQLVEQHRANLIAMQNDLTEHRKELSAERKRIFKALQKDGQTWTEKVYHDAPDFKPLQPGSRTTPVIAVLNLKGGVGKTTVTANLGTALDALGYRVLLLDIDLQGSLTNLFLTESQQEKLFNEERVLGDFFAASFHAEYPNLLGYRQPILQGGKSGLVPTTDWLAYAEMNLTIRWLLREGNRDPRFLLRRELHLKRITNEYDVVLLDCPPLINVSCVNALSASDYVLIPIMPSVQATVRVPTLLSRLKDFRENLNPDLNVLGILTNRTLRSTLTFEEENRLSALRAQCKDIWGQDLHFFSTFIRQSTAVRAAEDQHRPLGKNDDLYNTFAGLAREVTTRMPTFCRLAQDTDTPAREAVS